MRPNLLVFLTDDHGQWASRPYGNRELHTPTLDLLAQSGATMENAYTPCPVCSPARASFWTGRMPSQHGIHDWIHETSRPQPWLVGERTLAEALHEAGYQTALAGKWHCGQSWGPQPGFDYYLGGNRDQYPHRGVCKFLEDGRPIEHLGHRAAFVTSKAIEFLRRRERSRPFFLFVGYVDTHGPFVDHPERWVQAYADAAFSDIPDERYVGSARRIVGPVPSDPKERRQRLAQYYAAVSYIDEQVGQVLDALEGEGRLDETLVVYTSDHGHMNGHHGLYFKGNATSPQNFYDESIRVPCLLRWPGTIAAGRRHRAPVDHCDLFQTLLEAALCPETGEAAARRNSPGSSYLPLLRGERPPWRDTWFCEYGNAWMVRTRRWKLIVRTPPHRGDELYDLQTDPRETTNRIGEARLARVARDLRARGEAHFFRYRAPGRAGTDPLPSFSGHEPWLP